MLSPAGDLEKGFLLFLCLFHSLFTGAFRLALGYIITIILMDSFKKGCRKGKDKKK